MPTMISRCLEFLSLKRNRIKLGKQISAHTNNLIKQLLFCLFIFSIGIWLLYKTELEQHHTFFLPRNLDTSQKSRSYLISGPGCHIPVLELYDPSIIEALSEVEPPPDCDKNSTGILVKSNLTHLYIDPQVQSRLNFINLTCCVRPFWGPIVTSNYTYLYNRKCFPFKKTMYVNSVEFVRVECRSNNRLIKDFYSFIPNFYRVKTKNISPSKNVSILILGIDALSRLNFRRQMKYTYDLLVSQIKAVEFFGYHKVEDNTFPNVIPILAGVSEKELIKSCWPSDNKTFDNCSFIWDNFKRAGFLTGFGEDASWMGIFEYCKMGFRKKPTDVYLRTFNYVYEKELGYNKRLNANLCIGPKMNIEVLLDSVKKFVLRLQGKLSFGFFWENSLSHDFLNLPMYGDKIHLNLLEDFLKKGVFEQSVILIISDHGIRWGKIRKTYQGYMEERLPLLLFSCPEWFKKKFSLAWANLKKNSLRLTTPFDLHETLKDFLDLSLLSDRNIIIRSKALKNKGTLPRGISLFLPIPSERSCQDSDIADHWCACYKDESIPPNSTLVLDLGHFVLSHLNSFLKGYSQCSKLSLKTVISARLKVLSSDKASKEVLNFNETKKDYTVMFETKPGGGVFEATVEHIPSKDEFQLMGSITRSNTYGNSSYCVSHYKLKLYCYCKALIKP